MLEKSLVDNHVDRIVEERTADTLSRDDVLHLVKQLQYAGMLPASFASPEKWLEDSEIFFVEFVETIRENLSKQGYHRVLEAIRTHNRRSADGRWDISRHEDFLAAAESALSRHEVVAPAEIPESNIREVLLNMAGSKISTLAERLQREMQTVIQILSQPASNKGWLFSPHALWIRIKARARRANAEAQIERTLGEAAEYAARMVGNDMERSVALSQVDRLRDQLRDQLNIFCGEQGIAVPKPYSREEAYCLHLLTAYYVSLAEAQKVIAKHGAALAHKQITLQGEKTAASIDIKFLPDLVTILSRVDPLREGFVRERARHKSSMLVSSFIGAIGGILWGIIEGINDVLIAGIARYAPVVAPALLVCLTSLVAQTVVNGVPLAWDGLVQYSTRALWNGALTMGATLVACGVWRYFNSREQNQEGAQGASEVDWEGPLNDIKTADETAR